MRLWTLAGKSWALTDPDPHSPQSGWRVGLCERPLAFLEQQASTGGIFSKRKKKRGTQWLFKEFSQQPPLPQLAAP